MKGSVSNIENINSGSKPNQFEKLYLQVRKSEQRIYTDDEVKRLPSVPPGHIHFKEWEIRKKSLNKFISFLKQKNKPLKILEIGCGNGWLSASIARSDQSLEITGADINNEELAQARRVFTSLPNLDFVYTNIDSGELKKQSFDVVLFAASIQYFSSLRKIIDEALKLLRIDGEIHIIDTIFYKGSEIIAAKKRSDDYFNSIGFPEAGKHYFHHSLDDLVNFEFKILQRPASRIGRIFGNTNPFYWIRITDTAID